jgi:HSP20 family protein
MSATLTKPRAAQATARNPLAALRQEFDDMMARVWDGEPEKAWFGGPFAPSADVLESENAFEVRMDLPGMESKDIDVQVHGNVMTISGHRQEEKEEKGNRFHRVERRTGSFSRTITLPCNVIDDEVAAEYSQGVLTVKLPKCEDAKTKKVAVKG